MSDGTVIWTLPDGHTYVTTPGSALLFPSLCAPTGDLPAVTTPTQERCWERTAMMPLRTTTQNRTRYVAAERAQNHQIRLAAQPAQAGPAPPTDDEDDDPPPF